MLNESCAFIRIRNKTDIFTYKGIGSGEYNESGSGEYNESVFNFYIVRKTHLDLLSTI